MPSQIEEERKTRTIAHDAQTKVNHVLENLNNAERRIDKLHNQRIFDYVGALLIAAFYDNIASFFHMQHQEGWNGVQIAVMSVCLIQIFRTLKRQ